MPNRGVENELRMQHRLLAILRILERLPGGTSNSYLLNDLLLPYALSGSAEEMREDLSQLNEIGAIALTVFGALHVAMLTERGVTLSQGREWSDLIKRPLADCPY